MTITVIGAGHIGSAIAAELTTRDEVEVVKICDSHTRSLQYLHETIDSDKLHSFQVDARDIETLTSILDGSDCVIASTSPELNPSLAERCLRIGSHFCDLGGLPDILDRHIERREEARERGLWIVPNCGLDPGLVNIICMTGIRKFDEAISAQIRVGDIPLEPEPPFSFRLAWSAEKLLDDYTNPSYRLENGSRTTAEPLTGAESIEFREPFGRLEAFRTAGSLGPLIQAVDGSFRELDHKTIRWPGHLAQMRFALSLGLAEPRSIDVRTHLTYRDVFARLLRKHLGGEFRDSVLCRVSITGEIDGTERTLIYQMIDRYDDERGMTAIRRCTSIPVVAVAIMLASGVVEGGGVEPPECIVPGTAFMADLREHGLEIEETWHDGRVAVTDIVP
jgi:saccharopine dehydrogenase-like NADP-dependent oxidoreductase